MVPKLLHVKYFHITLVVALYWTISITTVFVNKTLLSNQNIDAPFFVLFYQCLISVAICLIWKLLAKINPTRFDFPSGSPFNSESVFNVLPISILFTCMIVFNALCLKYVGVSFYYIGRSLTTVFNVVFTFVILKENISFKTFVCCIIIVSGFLLGIDEESTLGTFSIAGTISGLLGSMSLALYSVYTKKVFPFVNNNIWTLSYYNNVYSCLLIFPFIVIFGETGVIFSYEKLFDGKFWILMTIGGICGFSMGYVTSLQIKVTSPLTHNISGTAKACAQTIMATVWYNETKTWLWWSSNYIILIGSFGYASVKQNEMKKHFSQVPKTKDKNEEQENEDLLSNTLEQDSLRDNFEQELADSSHPESEMKKPQLWV